MGGGGQKKNRSTFGDITNAGAHPGKQVRFRFFRLVFFSKILKRLFLFPSCTHIILSFPLSRLRPIFLAPSPTALPCEMRRDISRTAAAARGEPSIEVVAAGEQQRPRRRSCRSIGGLQLHLAPPVPPSEARRRPHRRRRRRGHARVRRLRPGHHGEPLRLGGERF